MVNVTHLLDLSDEVLLLIIGQLTSPADLAHLHACCHRLARLTDSEIVSRAKKDPLTAVLNILDPVTRSYGNDSSSTNSPPRLPLSLRETILLQINQTKLKLRKSRVSKK